MFDQKHNLVMKDKDFFKKHYTDKTLFEKILLVRKTLRDLTFIPKIHEVNIKKMTISEKACLGINKKTLTDTDIKSIALTLKQLHQVKITKKTRIKLSDELTTDGRYNPYLVFQTILNRLHTKDKKIFQKYNDFIHSISNIFKCHQLCLVHGDLRPENMFFNSNQLGIIDWDDCRIDLAIVDIFVMFKNFDFTKKMKDVFWRNYRKPPYLTRDVTRYFQIIGRMWRKIREPIGLVIPTYNRCPHKRVSLNPLYTTIKSLIDRNKPMIDTIIIGDDYSQDYTRKTVDNLRHKYPKISFIYFKNKSRKKASYTRQKAIKKCPHQLFLMSDDDCIFPNRFLENTYNLYKTVRHTHPNICVLNLPYINKRFDFAGNISTKYLAKVDLINHWIYHNLDKYPKNFHSNYIEVDTFEGIYLADKSRLLSVGGYENLTDFTIDYAEHISLSHRVKKSGLKIFHAVGKQFLVTHLKFGDTDTSIDWNRVPKKYICLLKRANKPFISGDRMGNLDTLISLISSFTYFYFCISIKEGQKHIKKEMDFLLSEKIDNNKITAYKRGINEALSALYRRKIITNISKYQKIMNSQIDRTRHILQP